MFNHFLDPYVARDQKLIIRRNDLAKLPAGTMMKFTAEEDQSPPGFPSREELPMEPSMGP